MPAPKSEEERKGKTRSMTKCCTADCDVSVKIIEGYNGEVRCQNCWNTMNVKLQNELTTLKGTLDNKCLKCGSEIGSFAVEGGQEEPQSCRKCLEQDVINLKERVKEVQDELEDCVCGRDVYEEANTSLRCDCATLRAQLDQAQAKVESCKCDTSGKAQEKDRIIAGLEEELKLAKEKLIEQGVQLQRREVEQSQHKKAVEEMDTKLLELQGRTGEYMRSFRDSQDETAALRAQLDEYTPSQKSWAGITGSKDSLSRKEMPGNTKGETPRKMGNRKSGVLNGNSQTKFYRNKENTSKSNLGGGANGRSYPGREKPQEERLKMLPTIPQPSQDRNRGTKRASDGKRQMEAMRAAETSSHHDDSEVTQHGESQSEHPQSRIELGNSQQEGGDISLGRGNGGVDRFKGREKIIIVGDSMVRYTDKVVGLREEGSGKICIPGAGIKQVMAQAAKAAEKAHDNSKIFVSGGGDSLIELGVEGTVNAIVDGLQNMEKANKHLYSAFIGIIHRPRAGREYEILRNEVNSRAKVVIRTMIEEGHVVVVNYRSSLSL